ncbi:xanthine dehydrogenase family protein molybdopterin-binding subunit [Paenibacillus sp.]|jgi:carbon-monoxide dehydrogenase large subunit|uniref:xanthine dehydrogenase family protein molybdopterin-binding subunit n=1 Tax=Paenibacillus sp. TaxID=58172 RepID=UPI0028393EE6|nr:xanthine dehydrogenase family protein molybdopterin-binding subunit [Paenibacillus sp.]MDR0267475.1 xanthine dehydrogenase family protein molybdopterin-binding subunit [Paenibacillus sp.]
MDRKNQPFRREDQRFITGKGRFVGDIFIPGMHHVCFVRSTEPHARILKIDTSKAKLPGVTHILFSDDLEAHVGDVPSVWPVEGLQNPGHPLLAKNTVRYIGEPILMIVADRIETARRAAQLTKVTYQKLISVTRLEDTLEGTSATEIYPAIKQNVAYRWHREYGDPDVLRQPHRTLKKRMVIPRVAPLAMEPRGVVASYDEGRQRLDVYSGTQMPHALRLSLAMAIGHPEQLIQVICPDVGGAFGSKMNVYREEILIAYFAKRLRVPLRYIETRSENFTATTHGRGQIQDVTVYFSDAGKILGLDVTIHGSLGAYLQSATTGIPLFTTQMLSGCYDIPYINVKVVGYYTNQTPTDAYRGAGRPEAAFLCERVADLVARSCGIDPIDVRLMNFINSSEFPKEVVTGLTYDSGEYKQALLKAVELIHLSAWRKEQQQRRHNQSRKQIGIGFSSYAEFSGTGPSYMHGKLGLMTSGFDSAVVRVHSTGGVTVISGVSPTGQGHHTSFVQIVSDALGVSADQIEIITGDTRHSPWGGGTYGSRSLAVGGTAVFQACEKVIAKGKEYLGRLEGIPLAQIRFEAGVYHIKDKPYKTLTDVAQGLNLAHQLPSQMEPGLEATVFFEPPNYTFPFGTHIAIVEVDTLTGEREILQLAAVDDCGEVIHEQLVHGQVIGGIMQGIGEALFEEIVHNQDDGSLVTHSFRTYHLPKAADMPPVITARTCTPSPVNPLGVKGVGEAGTIGSLPAVVNAIVDALSIFGIDHVDIPVTPQKIWELTVRAKEEQVCR